MTPRLFLLVFGVCLTLFVAAIPHIIWFLGWLVSLIFGHHLKYAPFGWTALGLAVAIVLFLSYGFLFGRWQLKVKELNYANVDIPEAFDGFRIVHISDLHLNTFDDRPGKLEKFIETINAQKPDFICFTGDLVTDGCKEAEPYTETLLKLQSKYGVASVLGNHDFLIYERRFQNDEERIAALDSLVAYERNTLGWHLLRNSSMKIEAPDGSHITIVGVDNKHCWKYGPKAANCGDLPKALDGTGGFRILLSHDPNHWNAEVLPQTDIPLTLSGHTHAAQFMLFNWTPASLIFSRPYGRYDVDGQTLYVNPGLGCTVPFRIGAGPEITVITLDSIQ